MQIVVSWVSFSKTCGFFLGADTKAEPGCTGASGYFNGLAENINQGELMYPEICMLELNLLSAGNASLDVLAHVFQSCLNIINQKERNAAVLIEQVKMLLIEATF